MTGLDWPAAVALVEEVTRVRRGPLWEQALAAGWRRPSDPPSRGAYNSPVVTNAISASAAREARLRAERERRAARERAKKNRRKAGRR